MQSGLARRPQARNAAGSDLPPHDRHVRDGPRRSAKPQRGFSGVTERPGLAGTAPSKSRCEKDETNPGAFDMGRGLILWLIGIPLPIILLLWAFGFLS
jgi:hypothetical protein